ncbi:MAG: hypothetical protein KDJ90_06915 [Nitratireductor sp.]|nr:hypothetical protein [Nitratireductor sp.]
MIMSRAPHRFAHDGRRPYALAGAPTGRRMGAGRSSLLHASKAAEEAVGRKAAQPEPQPACPPTRRARALRGVR